MAQFAVPHPQDEPRQHAEIAAANVASPAPLGLGIIGLITAIVGCFYTGFIIPFNDAGMRTAVGIAMVISGIILVLAGMWDFRKGYMMTASTFTAYGGFLAILGLVFFPPVVAAMGMGIHLFMGMLFLSWTILVGVLCLGSIRTNASLVATLGLLFVSYFFLMLGSLANNNGVLLRIGGWVAIATAVVAWAACLVSLYTAGTGRAEPHTPFGGRLAVVE